MTMPADDPRGESVYLRHQEVETLPGIEIPEGIDPERPSAARMYAYYLGSAHCFAADREAADRALHAAPWIKQGVIQNRQCLTRMVTRLVREAGVTQFLDIGSGLPTEGQVHEVAQSLDRRCRVVYVDRDPIAVAHSRAILAGNDQATIVQVDMHDPAAVLGHDEVRRLLDVDAPVALLMLSVLMWVTDPWTLVPQYTAVLEPGSYLAVTHASRDYAPAGLRESIEAVDATYAAIGQPVISRTMEQVESIVTGCGMDLVSPGVCFIRDWRPDLGEDQPASDADRIGLAVMGRKP